MSGRAQISGDFGMVAASHWLASAAGFSVLEHGGNAADAAAAAGFALQVVAPALHGPGGEAAILLWAPDALGPVAVNGQGRSPRAATIEHFVGLGLDRIPGTGLLPATVPGAFGAWLTVLERYGTLRLRDVLRYAIGFAERGFALDGTTHENLSKVEDLFRSDWTTSAEQYLESGGVPAPGSRFRNCRLAATFRRVLDEAEATGGDRFREIERARFAFYRGFVADAVADFYAVAQVGDGSGERHGGLLDREDMAGFVADVEPTAAVSYGPCTVHKTGPWGQGPVLLQQLGMLEDRAPADPLSGEYVHVVTECAKLAFADREAWYGDPDHWDTPLAALLSRSYAAERRLLVSDEASAEFRPGSPDGRAPAMPEGVARVWSAAGRPARDAEPVRVGAAPLHGDTCHLDVADAAGMMISATPSGGWLQGAPVVPSLGFSMGVRGQTFWLEPGHAGSLSPGRRPRTTLSPTLVGRDGRPVLACGTIGGDQQDQWQVALLMAVVDAGASLQDAIDMPRFHMTHFPSSFSPRSARPGRIVVEDRFDHSVLADLRKRGHEVKVIEKWSVGPRMCAVGRDPDTGLLVGAADARGGHAQVVGR